MTTYPGRSEVSKILKNIDSVQILQPAGSITAFAGTTAPDGWLECDGSAVSRSTYARLYTNIGDSWGEGDGSTTFNLPDLIGRFLRGRDTEGTRDADYEDRTACNTGGNEDGEVGSVQDDAMQRISGRVDFRSIDGASIMGGVVDGGFSQTNASASQADIAAGGSNEDRDRLTFDSANSTSPNTAKTSDTETRPKNASVMYIIKT